jgi:hypothetical protein
MRGLFLTCLAAMVVFDQTGQCFDKPESSVVFHFYWQNDGVESKPLVGAIVYLRPTDRIKGDETLVSWLQEKAKPPKSRVHRFAIVDGQLTPQNSIVYVGDSLYRKLEDNLPLDFEAFDNKPDSGLDPEYTFRCSELTVINLKVLGRQSECKSASILVTDHTVHGITDKSGRVEFPSLPQHEKLTFFVNVTLQNSKHRLQCSSPTLKTSGYGRIAIDTRLPSQDHSIYVKEIPK